MQQNETLATYSTAASIQSLHSAAPPSPLRRRFNRDNEGVSAEWQYSRRWLGGPVRPAEVSPAHHRAVDGEGPRRHIAGAAAEDLWPSAQLSFCWHSRIVSVETPTKGRGGCSRMTVSPVATKTAAGLSSVTWRAWRWDEQCGEGGATAARDERDRAG